MTKSEEMKRFEADMASDKELYEKFYKTVDRIAGEKTAQSDGELFANAAQELGYNITAADFERLDAEREEISTDELKQVAGGYYYERKHESEDEHGHDVQCLTAWHCVGITCHTETDSKHVACWKDYLCYIVNHWE